MIIKLAEPLVWEEKTYEQVELDLSRLRGKDKLAILKRLRQEHRQDPILQPETDDRYLVAVAARASKIPEEALGELTLPEYSRVILEVQSFLLGEAVKPKPEAPPTT